ncbi:hypothetical protein TELCIR_23777, partial [Teladorsagia circumcincta]
LCPLMIRLLGVPDRNVPDNPSISTEEPLGQGQMAKFTLSPAVVANPEATRVLYQILEQLIRIMAGIPSVNSVLEALFHKAFLFPKIEQRAEAVRIIKKLQGILNYCESPDLLDEETRWKLKEMFPSLADVNPPSFTSRSDVGQCSPLPPANAPQKQNDAAATDDETEDVSYHLVLRLFLEV